MVTILIRERNEYISVSSTIIQQMIITNYHTRRNPRFARSSREVTHLWSIMLYGQQQPRPVYNVQCAHIWDCNLNIYLEIAQL